MAEAPTGVKTEVKTQTGQPEGANAATAAEAKAAANNRKTAGALTAAITSTDARPAADLQTTLGDLARGDVPSTPAEKLNDIAEQQAHAGLIDGGTPAVTLPGPLAIEGSKPTDQPKVNEDGSVDAVVVDETKGEQPKQPDLPNTIDAQIVDENLPAVRETAVEQYNQTTDDGAPAISAADKTPEQLAIEAAAEKDRLAIEQAKTDLANLTGNPEDAAKIIADDPENAQTAEEILAGQTEPAAVNKNATDALAQLEEKAKTKPLTEGEKKKMGVIKAILLIIATLPLTVPLVAVGGAVAAGVALGGAVGKN